MNYLLNKSEWERFVIKNPFDCDVYTWRNSQKSIDLILTIYHDSEKGAISLDCKKEYAKVISQTYSLSSLHKLEFIEMRDEKYILKKEDAWWQYKYDELLYEDWRRRFTKFFRVCDNVAPIPSHIKSQAIIDLNFKEYELDGSLLKYEKYSAVHSLELLYLLKTHFYSIFIFKLMMCRYKARKLNHLVVPRFVQQEIFSYLFDNKFEWKDIQEHCSWFAKEIKKK